LSGWSALTGAWSVRSSLVEPEYVETQPTKTPYFGEAEPHPSTPAGQIKLWGSLARRAGPAVIRSLLLAGLIVAVLALVVELT
jgi:hypothetical protein